jgi:hypothetical protein
MPTSMVDHGFLDRDQLRKAPPWSRSGTEPFSATAKPAGGPGAQKQMSEWHNPFAKVGQSFPLDGSPSRTRRLSCRAGRRR